MRRGLFLPLLLEERAGAMAPLLSIGRSAKEIANALNVSHETARNHIRAVLGALGAHSQLEAVSHARALGVLA